MKEYVGLITRTIKQWLKNKPFQQSAVIAYYTLFSLPGLLMIVISIAGYFFGKSTVQDRIIQQLAEFIGTDAAITIEQRSEEHTSELQSRGHLVCRLLLEKKKK